MQYQNFENLLNEFNRRLEMMAIGGKSELEDRANRNWNYKAQREGRPKQINEIVSEK